MGRSLALFAACALFGVALGRFTVPGHTRAQTDDELRLPGSMCQPVIDNQNIQYLNHSMRNLDTGSSWQGFICPFFATYQYRAGEMEDGESTMEVRVYDANTSLHVLTEGCRSSGNSSSTMNCGTSDSSSGTGYFTLHPTQMNTGSNDDVWYVHLILPDKNTGSIYSHVLYYWVHDD